MEVRFKGLFLLVLAFAMCFSLMSISAFANDATSQSSDDPITFKVTGVSGDNIGLQLAIFQFTGTENKLLKVGDSCTIGTGGSSINLSLAFATASNSTKDANWSSSPDALTFGGMQQKSVGGTTYKYYPVSLSSTPVTGPITITATVSNLNLKASVTLVKTISIPDDAIAYVGDLEDEKFLNSVSGLQAAINAATPDTTITLVKDVELTENFDGKSVNIQGNGNKFKVTSNVNIKISNLVVDSSACALEATSGTVELENAKISTPSAQHALVINGGNVTIAGDETVIRKPDGFAIDVSADYGRVSKLTVNAGNISSIGDDVGIPGSHGRAEITVNGGMIDHLRAQYDGDKVTVTNGTINELYAYNGASDTVLTVSGGRVGNQNNDPFNFRTITITGGYFKVDPTPKVVAPYKAAELTDSDANYADGYRWKVGLDHTFNSPVGLTATYGQKLADVTLVNPAGNQEGTWTWVDSTMSVGDAGERTFKANFTPTDPKYIPKSNVDVIVTVGKAGSAVTAAPTAKTLTSSGTAQELVTAGAATGGTMQYALGEDKTTAPTTGYTASIPTAINAGTYFVWYKVVGDANHDDVAPACVEVNIAEGTQGDAEAQGNVKADVIIDEGAPALSATNMDKVAEAVLAAEEKAKVASGAEAKVWLEDAALSEDKVPAEDAAALKSACASLGLTPGAWLDISLRKQVGGGEVIAVHRSSVAVAFTLEVPEGLRATGRTFHLLRYHDGDVSELGRTTGDAIEGESELFSTYLIAYSDGQQSQAQEAASTSQSQNAEQTKKSTTSSSNASSAPKTSDTISAIGWLICLVINATAVVYARFKLRTRKS